MKTLTIIVSPGNYTYKAVLKQILESKLDKKQYEVIFLGRREKGFAHVTITKEHPLVRGFYDSVLNRNQRINAAIAESHGTAVMLWPNITFLKSDFKFIPSDVKDVEYYIALWMTMQRIPAVPEFKVFGNEHNRPKTNLKDLLRFAYLVGDQKWSGQLWYCMELVEAIVIRIFERLRGGG